MEELDSFSNFIIELDSEESDIFVEMGLEDLIVLEGVIRGFCLESLDEAWNARNIKRAASSVGKSVLGKIQRAVSSKDRSENLGRVISGVAKSPFKLAKGVYSWNRQMPNFRTADDFIDFYRGKVSQAKDNFSNSRMLGREKRRAASEKRKANLLARRERLGLTPEKIKQSNAGLNRAVFMKKRQPSLSKDDLGLTPEKIKQSNAGMTKQKLISKISQPKPRIKLKVPKEPVVKDIEQNKVKKPRIRIKSSAVPVKPVDG